MRTHTAISMKLIAKSSNDYAPQRILCLDKQHFELATVYCDGEVNFTRSTISQHELKEILTISENFKLFFNNLTKSV